MIIQRNIPRPIIKVNSRNNHMRDARVIREQRKQRVVSAV